MVKPQVLFIGDLNKDLPEYKAFAQKYECIDYTITTKEQLLDDFRSKFSNIQAIYGAWLGFIYLGGFKGEILDNSPPHLKVISICSVGHEPYDGSGLAEKNIVLTNVPSIGAAEPVADLVLYNTLAAFRNFKFFEANFGVPGDNTVQMRAALDAAKFDSETGKNVIGEIPNYSFGHVISGRSCLNPRNHHVAILGFGQIGKAIASKLAHLGMHIHYVKRSRLNDLEERELGYKVQYHPSLYDVTEFADLVVVVAPGTAETKHLVNAKLINSFKKPIRIINVGRGSIIDEQALVDGLKQGKVAFAGLDVYENEPSIHPELYGRQDVILTPHVGASTVENFDTTAIQALRNIDNVLTGGAGLNRVN